MSQIPFPLEALNAFPSIQHFGINFDEVRLDSICASVRVDERHLRPGGIVNGGIYLLLIETVGSISASAQLDIQKQNALGIQVSANHLGSAKEGDTLIATSQAVHIGKSTHIWEVVVKNQNQKLLSSGRITMMIVAK